MPDPYSPLWRDDEGPFWKKLEFEILRQRDYGHSTCVPTSLAMVASALSGQTISPYTFMEGDQQVNTQSPQDWSDKLQHYGAHLAYCNFDGRNLSMYLNELVKYNDLFLIGFYSDQPKGDAEVGQTSGSSHMITLYQNKIYDTASMSIQDAVEYDRRNCAVKRIFRIVPKDHPRKV